MWYWLAVWANFKRLYIGDCDTSMNMIREQHKKYQLNSFKMIRSKAPLWTVIINYHMEVKERRTILKILIARVYRPRKACQDSAGVLVWGITQQNLIRLRLQLLSPQALLFPWIYHSAFLLLPFLPLLTQSFHPLAWLVSSHLRFCCLLTFSSSEFFCSLLNHLFASVDPTARLLPCVSPSNPPHVSI